jgi:mono/diheme cytochrome c family protein
MAVLPEVARGVDVTLTLCRTIQRVAALLAVAAPTLSYAAAAGTTPTFTRDVAPIVFAHCASCHREGEVGAAVPLMTYTAVRARAAAIKTSVAARTMPPWPADPRHSVKFRNDARLSQQDVDMLVAWVDAGAQKGNDADLPPLPPPPPKWLHPGGIPPDAVLTLPEVSVSATGEIPYLQQRVKVPLSEDKWISAMQVVPGNNALVHHMGITEVVLEGLSPGDLDSLTKAARQMGLADDALMHPRPAVLDALNPESYDMLGVYTPGSTFEMYDADSGKLLKSGKDLYVNFNIHYTTTGKPEKNRSELALWFGSQRPSHQLIRAPVAVSTIIANGRELLTDDPGTKAEGTDVAIPPIPPYAKNYELVGVTAFTQPVTLYQLQPHAHMRGKDFTYAVVFPDGRKQVVLSVPKYDFHWQLAYQLETPLHLPAGSKLIVTAHYDNSTGNTHLREHGVDPQNCGPDKEAYFRRQNQSWHEMFSPLVQYSIDAAANAQPLQLVETVGCLKQGVHAEWSLISAHEPAASRSQSTSATELRGATTALGNGSFELLGAAVFHPQSQSGGRVAVKGVLVPDIGGDRLNVTSLQPVPGACL